MIRVYNNLLYKQYINNECGGESSTGSRERGRKKRKNENCISNSYKCMERIFRYKTPKRFWC